MDRSRRLLRAGPLLGRSLRVPEALGRPPSSTARPGLPTEDPMTPPELLEQLTAGITRLTTSARLAALPRLSGPLPPLQLRQRRPHRSAAPRRHPGGRLRHLEAAAPLRPQGGEGDLDPGSGPQASGRRRGRRGASRAGVSTGGGVRRVPDRRRAAPRRLSPSVRRRPDGPLRPAAGRGRGATWRDWIATAARWVAQPSIAAWLAALLGALLAVVALIILGGPVRARPR